MSEAQGKTLRTMIARGGEMNGYAGQPGFYCNSVNPLIRMGLLERVDMCEGCRANNRRDFATDPTVPCERPLTGQKGGQSCYRRVRVTETGRAAVERWAAR